MDDFIKRYHEWLRDHPAEDYNPFDGTEVDRHRFRKGELFVKGTAIINEYISHKDAMIICYCFN